MEKMNFLLLILLFTLTDSCAIQQKQREYALYTSKRTFYSAPITYYANHCCYNRLLLCGDVEINPGPILCASCNKTVRINSKRLECVSCKEQLHHKCAGKNVRIDNARVPYLWTCHTCTLTIQPFFNIRNLSDLDSTVPDLTNGTTPPSVALLDQHRKHLSIAHLNTQSMKSTFAEFESYLSTHQFDIITMSETWLKDNKNLLSHYEIAGYEKDFRNRDAKRGGGVGYYIKSNILHKARKDIESFDTTIEHQWIELTGKNRLSNVLIGIVYQPSSKSRDKLDWLVKFESLISQ
eukprot:TCONS_00037449-protein